LIKVLSLFYFKYIFVILFHIYSGLLLWYGSNKHKSLNNDSTVVEIESNDEIKWSIHYAALVKYGEEYGTCNIPQNTAYKCILPDLGENGSDYEYKRNLGMWLYNQRQAKSGHGAKLKTDQEKLLQKLVDKGKS
jgi:hypothetical protein